jgi:methyl-accepting chemotaxis protein
MMRIGLGGIGITQIMQLMPIRRASLKWLSNQARVGIALALAMAVLMMFMVWLVHPWLVVVIQRSTGLELALAASLGTLFLMSIYLAVLFRFPGQLPSISLRLQGLVETSEANQQRVSMDMQSLLKLNEILRGHLTDATAGSEAAALVIITRLREVHQVSSTLLEILRDQQRRATEFASDQQQRLLINQDMLKSVSGYQVQRQQDTRRIDKVFLRVQELAGLTDIISQVSAQTNMLAVNAAIQAAHAGEAGRGFKVVADEVRLLSRQTADAAQRIHKVVDAVNAAVKESLSGVFSEVSTQEANEQMTVITDKVTELAVASQEMAAYLCDITHRGFGASETIFSDVLGMLDEMQFQDISRQQIEQVQNAMTRVDGYCRELAGHFDQQGISEINLLPLGEIIESIHESYVMQSQRTVHQGVLGATATEAAAPKFELF